VADRIRFYFDENFPGPVARSLQRRGIDVLTVHEAGRNGFLDEEQLAFAFQQRRVMVKLDSDYITLAAQEVPHAGIAYAQPQSRSIGELVQALTLIFEVLEPDDMMNHIEYL